MVNNSGKIIIALLAVLLSWGCSSQPETKKVHLSAQFSTADTARQSSLAGITITVTQKDSANAEPDTLFNKSTDSSGLLAGTVAFDEKRQFPVIISRNNKNLTRVGIILADGDSVTVKGTVPNLSNSLSISSREHKAMENYRRINSGYQRIQRFAEAGRLTGDSLRREIKKWSNLFWQVHEQNDGTIASGLAARNAITLLQGIDNKKMMSRLRSVQKQDQFSDLGATVGKSYLADSLGLESALAYLDTLQNITETPKNKMQIKRERIKLLYDSARVDAAKQQLKAFKKQFPKNERPQDWVESISYDLNYMSPGDSIPDFQFTENGTTVSRDSLLGTPYILEVTRLSNNLYQRQFDRTVAIHSIYKNYGLQVVTLPLDDSQITVDAFFQERPKPWPVADAQTFDRQQLIKEFNIRLVPTRFLIDRNGEIIRKYVGNEYQDVVNGIQTLIKKDKKPAS